MRLHLSPLLALSTLVLSTRLDLGKLIWRERQRVSPQVVVVKCFGGSATILRIKLQHLVQKVEGERIEAARE